MGNREKLLIQIRDGRNDANVAFEDLCNLLLHLGFALIGVPIFEKLYYNLLLNLEYKYQQ